MLTGYFHLNLNKHEAVLTCHPLLTLTTYQCNAYSFDFDRDLEQRDKSRAKSDLRGAACVQSMRTYVARPHTAPPSAKTPRKSEV